MNIKRFSRFSVTWLAAVIWLAACTAPASLTPGVSATPAATQPPAATLSPTRVMVTPTHPGVTPTASLPGGDELPPFMPALQKFALDKMNARPDEIRLIKMEPVDWPDTCLGAAQAGEICAQVITPGYRLQVEIKGKVYELHSDSGKFIRQPAVVPDTTGINPAAEAARLWLMDLLKVDASAIRILTVTEQNWPDGCLGVYKPETVCTSVLVPGYRVTLEARGAAYEIRTSRDGKNIVLADRKYQLSNPSGGGLERPQMTWKNSGPKTDGDGAKCLMLQAANDQAAFGACGAPLTVVTLTNPERIKELDALLKAYHPFNNLTPAGEITFYGGGTGNAGPAQQRALAEWGQMLYLEVSSKALLPNNGLALTWRRTGGIAGFCDDLKVYRSGLVAISSCRSNNQPAPTTQWLNTAQLEQLFTWLDTLPMTDGKQGDPAVADGMNFTWVLSGNGTRPASAAERQAIFNFAVLLMTGR